MAVDGKSARRVTAASRDQQAAVLAHDINNLLGVILNANEALTLNLAAGSDARELSRMSQDAAEQAAVLLARLLDLAEPGDRGGEACDALEAAGAAARRLQGSAPEGITVAARLAHEPLACLADRADLDSALLNLGLNAQHAMPEGGVLWISAEPSQDGQHVVLAVRDTGVGMSPDVLARACDPYFTTRRDEGGTGLGLAGVQDFARRAGGRLELTSEPGQGTTARLVLPRAPGQAAPAAKVMRMRSDRESARIFDITLAR